MLGYPHYWDAPIFAPQPGAFAFSESQPVSGLLAAPLWLSLRSPALAYNGVVLLFLTLNGWFTYWLMRQWRASRLAALVTGLLVQGLPFIAQEMGVLQLIALFGILWSLLFLHRILATPSPRPPQAWRGALGLALGPPVTFFTCSYYGLLSLFFLPLAFLFNVRKGHFTRRTGGRLLLIALLTIILSVPFLLSQQRRLADLGYTRSATTIENNSAKLKYYTYTLDYNLLYGQILGRSSPPGQRLFPGLGLILLAGVGLGGLSRIRTKLYLAGAIGLALLLSLGLRINLDGVQPYQWIREIVPGFAQLRSPFRFAAFAQLHLVLLAGLGLDNVRAWFPSRRHLLISLIGGLVLFEALALPLPLQPLPDQQTKTAWQGWINAQQPASRLILLPFPEKNGVAYFEPTTRWMLASRYLQGNMLNGYSGFFPTDHAHLREKMLAFPSRAGIKLLYQKGVDYVVVYERLPQAPSATTLETHLRLVYRDPAQQVAVYALPPPETVCEIK